MKIVIFVNLSTFDWFSVFLCSIKVLSCYLNECSLTDCRNGAIWDL